MLDRVSDPYIGVSHPLSCCSGTPNRAVFKTDQYLIRANLAGQS